MLLLPLLNVKFPVFNLIFHPQGANPPPCIIHTNDMSKEEISKHLENIHDLIEEEYTEEGIMLALVKAGECSLMHAYGSTADFTKIILAAALKSADIKIAVVAAAKLIIDNA